MNKAHIKYLENHLYILANESKRYELVNSNIPAEVSISEMDRAEMDEFIDNMRLILGVLGHKILEPSISKVADNVATSVSKSVVDKRRILFDKGRKVIFVGKR